MIELAVDPRRKAPRWPCCLCETSGKGYPIDGDDAVGEKGASDRGLTGEAISLMLRTGFSASLIKAVDLYAVRQLEWFCAVSVTHKSHGCFAGECRARAPLGQWFMPPNTELKGHAAHVSFAKADRIFFPPGSRFSVMHPLNAVARTAPNATRLLNCHLLRMCKFSQI